MPEYRTITDAKAHLNEIVEALQRGAERVVVTRSGVPAALILGWDEWEGLLETIEIMGASGALKDIQEGERAVAQGDYATLDDLLADLHARSELASEE